MGHKRTAVRLALSQREDVVEYVSDQLREAYVPLDESWRQLSGRLSRIERDQSDIVRQQRFAPDRGRGAERRLAVYAQENLPSLRQDLEQVRSAGRTYVEDYDEKSRPWERNPRVMNEFRRQRREFDERQLSMEQTAGNFLLRMEESALALPAPPYSLEPSEQEQTLAGGVPTTFPQAPAPAHSLLPTGQERVLHQPPPYAGPSHLPWQPQPGGPARRPPSR